jgi:predicted RNase H-like HicB family nuclease
MSRKVAFSKTQALGIRFTAQAWKEGSAYVAYSPELDVSSCGDSPAQAKSRLREAAAAFLEEAARMGTLNELLFPVH